MLADTYDASGDGRSYTFHLREEAAAFQQWRARHIA